MSEENEQKRKNKDHKDSSANMIDSFFGSHNLENQKTNQNENHDFKETEQLIDKVLGEKSISENQHDASNTEVDFLEEDNKNPPFQEPEASDNEESFENKNQRFDQHPKEEIFEIDKPTKQKQNDEKEASSNNQFEKQVKTDQKTNKTNRSKNKQNNGKINFSLNLPKINIKFGRKKKQTKTNVEQAKDQIKQKQNVLSEKPFNEELTKASPPTGRIHGLNKIKEAEEQNTTIKQKESFEKPKRKKKSLFESAESSFHFFKKKGENKPKKFTKKQDFNEKINEETPQTKKSLLSSKSKSTVNEEATVDEEIIKMLKITDDLLGKLPEEVIEEFSQSEDFSLYEKVMKKYDIVK